MPEEQIVIENPRYVVEKADPYGYSIIDTTGQDEPYTICFARNTEDELDADWFELETNFKLVAVDGKEKCVHCQDPAYMTSEQIRAREAHDLKTAASWCETWNLVELGYCGSCKRKFTEGERKHSAVGFHKHDRIICFACACSQED